MSRPDESSRPATGEPPEAAAYEPPAVVWEEPYEDVVLALYCARQSGNPGCNPGPFTN